MLILAPLRGVTIRCFRECFADEIREAGFTEAITPFITANRGVKAMNDRELRGSANLPHSEGKLKITPQFIGKDSKALKDCLLEIKAAGYDAADLNCGCPYPMVRNKGRGSGLLRMPSVMESMIATGCEVMGPGKFSVKARLGVERKDELLKLLPMINSYPLRFLTVHGRVARQMYEGACDDAAVDAVVAAAKVPVVRNGDIPLPLEGDSSSPVMIGRAFIRSLGDHGDILKSLSRYMEASAAELCGERAVLGRMKELFAYWKESPRWRRRWEVIKLCRTMQELRSVLGGVES